MDEERIKEAARMSLEVRGVFMMELEEAGEPHPRRNLFAEMNRQVCAKVVELELERMYRTAKK